MLGDTSGSTTIFMYGSCVTRDCLPEFESLGLRHSRQVSGQSVISAMTTAYRLSEYIDELSSLSGFQRQSLIGDISGSLLPELRREFDNSSYLLMDLTDERGGVWIDSSGRRATNTLELHKSGVLERWDSGRSLIDFGTDDHFDLWSESFRNLHNEVVDLGIEHRVSVIRAPWATESVEGDTFPFGEGRLDPKRMNVLYDRYFKYIVDMTGFHLLEVPKELCLTTRRHQWGIAPYHYVPEFHEYVARAVKRRIEALGDE